MGDEADADWQAGLIEAGRESVIKEQRDVTFNRRRHYAKSRWLYRQRRKAKRLAAQAAANAQAQSRTSSCVGTGEVGLHPREALSQVGSDSTQAPDSVNAQTPME